jgi:hypothetical protein
MVGGEMGALKGLSVLRTEARATITALGGTGEEVMACSMEVVVRGPSMIVKPEVGVREDEERTSAVRVWPLVRASEMISLPVRPLPPMMRRCIFVAELGFVFRSKAGELGEVWMLRRLRLVLGVGWVAST